MVEGAADRPAPGPARWPRRPAGPPARAVRRPVRRPRRARCSGSGRSWAAPLWAAGPGRPAAARGREPVHHSRAGDQVLGHLCGVRQAVHLGFKRVERALRRVELARATLPVGHAEQDGGLPPSLAQLLGPVLHGPQVAPGAVQVAAAHPLPRQPVPGPIQVVLGTQLGTDRDRAFERGDRGRVLAAQRGHPPDGEQAHDQAPAVTHLLEAAHRLLAGPGAAVQVALFDQRAAGMLTGVPANQSPLVTFDLAGPKNGGKGFYEWDKNNFAPRVAVAWTPHPKAGFTNGSPASTRWSCAAGTPRCSTASARALRRTSIEGLAFGMSTSIASPFGAAYETDPAVRF